MKTLDKIVKWISWATLVSLIAVVICRRMGFFCPPVWIQKWLIPILTASAVGYLTNWIAIWLLFKPYQKHGFIQGVIPRNKERMGHELGKIIPEYLLKPDELAEEIGIKVRNYLQDPMMLNDLREKVNKALKRYSSKIASFIITYTEDTLRTAIKDNVTQEKLSAMYDSVVMHYFEKIDNRMSIAKAITTELQSRSPEIIAAVQSNVREGTKKYIAAEYPKLSVILKADEFCSKLVDYLNWEHIGSQIAEKLGEEYTQRIISDELTALTIKLQAYLKSSGTSERMVSFINENRMKAEKFIKSYLTEHIPALVDGWLNKDELWNALEYKLLPMVQAFILNKLKHDKEIIIKGFDLPGKIEHSVNDMNVATLHEMLLKACDDNLTVIQLLGYVLGMFAGILLIFAE